MTVTASPADTRARELHHLLAASAEAHARLSWDEARLREHQQRRLRELLAVAVERSPYHADRLGGIDPATFTLDRLPTLPTMTKAEMMADLDRAFTDPALSRSLVEDHLTGSTDELTYLLDRHVVMVSGGSSGERGVFVHDRAGFAQFAHALTRETIATLRAFGITADAPVRGAMVGAGRAVHGTAALRSLVSAPGGLVRLDPMPATLPFEEVVARLQAAQPAIVVGYPTILARLADARRRGELAINPLAVTCTSEPLTSAMRAEIERGLGVPVVNTFGSTEGLVGTSAPGQEPIRFAEDGCIIELVDEHDAPVPPGATAAKVLVTNLANHAQPLIRYELTDRFRAVDGDWPDAHLRAVVDGRSDEALRWGRIMVHPTALRSVLVAHAEVFEYQVRQRPDGVAVAVVAAAGFDPVVLRDGLAAALRAAGAPATVGVEVVDTIARDPFTGKAPRFVPIR